MNGDPTFLELLGGGKADAPMPEAEKGTMPKERRGKHLGEPLEWNNSTLIIFPFVVGSGKRLCGDNIETTILRLVEIRR